jgi:hypothetical protein
VRSMPGTTDLKFQRNPRDMFVGAMSRPRIRPEIKLGPRGIGIGPRPSSIGAEFLPGRPGSPVSDSKNIIGHVRGFQGDVVWSALWET